jgi:hypothetical protein
MNLWLLRAEIAFARYRPVVMVGLVLAAIVVLGTAALATQHKGIAALEGQKIARASKPNDRVPVTSSSDAERLAEFDALLGERVDVDSHLRVLFETAQKNGLRLDVGEYRMTDVPAGRYQRYEVLLPIEGRYGAIQSFSQQILLGMPFAALEDIVIRRESVNAPVVEAKLRFALYLRSAPTPAQAPVTARSR